MRQRWIDKRTEESTAANRSAAPRGQAPRRRLFPSKIRDAFVICANVSILLLLVERSFLADGMVKCSHRLPCGHFTASR
jgi:hypothetical protein